jgi:hypothetical protein
MTDTASLVPNRETLSLFDGCARTDTREQGYSKNSFTFYNRIAGVYWQRVRDLADDWYRRMPDEVAPDIRLRLRCGDDRSFYGAFWEMYCYETLIRLGYEVESRQGATPGALPTMSLWVATRPGPRSVQLSVPAPYPNHIARSKTSAGINHQEEHTKTQLQRASLEGPYCYHSSVSGRWIGASFDAT